VIELVGEAEGIPLSARENAHLGRTIHVSPNPARSLVRITLPRGGSIALVDALGRVALRRVVPAEVTTLDVSILPRGAYRVVRAGDGLVESVPLIIE
jgi:hypothetical protein